MAYKLVILPIAEVEIEAAYEYYAQFSKSAVKSFKKQLSESYKRIRNNPFFAVKHRDIRALPFSKYPFLVFFRIDENAKIVYILSVFNTYQNPEKYP
ncbi:MAG: type II toxin-antitoxin system RelE/ParE family toxin [Bergeyella sp.]